MHQKAVEITRTFPAARQKLFRYFVTPSLLEKWAFPDGMTLRVPVLEAKPGGRYRWEHTQNGGTYVAEGHFEELGPDRIVQIDEEIEDPAGKVLHENLLCAVSFLEQDGSTKVRIEQSGFREQKDADECRQGWEQCLARLEQVLGKDEKLARPA